MRKVVDGRITYGVHEVYYEGDKITGYTLDPEVMEIPIDHTFDYKDRDRKSITEEICILLETIISDIKNPLAEVLDWGRVEGIEDTTHREGPAYDDFRAELEEDMEYMESLGEEDK
jgi:hypothetical protein